MLYIRYSGLMLGECIYKREYETIKTTDVIVKYKEFDLIPNISKSVALNSTAISKN